MLQFSSNYRGAWIFQVAGVTDTNAMYRAAIKVFLAKYYFPIFVVIGVTYYVLFQRMQLIDLAIVLVGAILQTMLSYLIAVQEKYPFSAPFERLKSGGYTAKALLLMFLTVPFVLFHFLSSFLPFGLFIYFGLLLVATFLLWSLIFRKG
jgi:hypothetical protein